ncbi:hypothetical protein [Brachybacterium kimchii]|uniref:Uncharacterized protein n=1 Tax=Brachybacterium kimchii TaxID=2942909 RepID=A0ABY4ND12_9MICO|nr:hypothetical protein [Brachybacterium kimchii]UQN31796.1 hypothetical protein M4486_19595 [Brachybacterium kimchii]
MNTITRHRPVITRTATSVLIETPECGFCGHTGSVTLTADEAAALQDGAPIHVAAPAMSRSAREQYISGIHPDCWTELFG